MRRKLLFFLSHLLIIQLSGQAEYSFVPPLKIPMVLSGNFGEARADHFHSGIDIKTQGSTGHQVFAIESGYISRIKVQANGYGKSIYITHPNGFTSVYGHLDRYRDDLAEYVTQMQYRRRSHMVDLYPDPNQFKVQRGELIAFSGNTGSSSGPHLHFEVRNTANEHPTNVLRYNFEIADHMAPRFYSIFLQPVGEGSQVNGSGEKFSSSVVRDQGNYTIPYGKSIKASGVLGVSVEAFDFLDGAINRCGIYTLEMYLDGKLMYSHMMDEFSFSETRYVNARIDYAESIRTGTRAQRLHRLPNDRLRIYRDLEGDGFLELDEDRNYDILVVATDVSGNRSELKVRIKGEHIAPAVHTPAERATTTMKYGEPNNFSQNGIRVEIPANALYSDLDFSFDTSPAMKGSLTPFYHISTPEVPLHLPYTMAIKIPPPAPPLREKLLLITINDEGEVEAAGGEFKDGSVVANLRNFGSYAVGMDTIAPEVIPLNGSANSDLTGKKSLKFTIRDELSGIEKYEGYIDNSWVLFEYDMKNDLLTYTLDAMRLKSGMTHELELYVSDEKGNLNLFRSSFRW